MKSAYIKIKCSDGLLKVTHSAPNGNRHFSKLLAAIKDWESAKFHNDKKYWSVGTDMDDMKKRFCVGHFHPTQLEWEYLEL